MKKCCFCQEEKPLSEFNRKSSTKDGYQSKCRICSHAKFKEYYNKNREHHKREITKRKKKYLKIFAEYVNDIKSKGCSKCPEKTACCIDFHHLDPSQKEENIAQLLRYLNKKRLDEEIAKCILLCSNCHRKFHAGILQL